MTEETNEKQHKPTEKHLKELKNKGQFLRSKDLTGGTVLIYGILLFIFGHSILYEQLKSNFILSFSHWEPHDLEQQIFSVSQHTSMKNFLVILPFLALFFILPPLVGFLFGGFDFSFKSSGFKFNRLNPLKNLKNILSKNNAVETLKSILKIVVFITIAIVFFITHIEALLALTQPGHKHALPDAFALLTLFLFWCVLGIVLIMAIDMIYQYFSYQKKSKMTHQQIKDEQKDTEGSPEVKRKIRQTQQAMSRIIVGSRAELPLALGD